MSTRSERIKLLIKQSGKSYQELEKATGIKKSSLQRYATGVTAKIPLDVIEKLSKAFDVSQEYLMGWDEDKEKTTVTDGLSEEKKALIDFAYSVPEDKAAMILQVMKTILASD